MSEELKPCPFCGAQPTMQDVGDYFVECPSCGVQGPSPLDDGLQYAIDAWNTRRSASSTPGGEG